MLVSSTPLFSNVLSDLGLRHALIQQPKELSDIQLYLPYNSPNQADYQDTWSFIKQQVSSYLGNTVYKEERSIQSATFDVTQPSSLIDPTSQYKPSGYFEMYTNLYDHVRLVGGRYPNPSSSSTQPQAQQQNTTSSTGEITNGLAVEALIGTETAKVYNLKIGDQITLYSDMWGNGPTQLIVTVTGTIEPKDTKDEFWFLSPDIFVPPVGSVSIPLFIPEETIWNKVVTVFPGGNLTYNWYYYVDINRINTVNAKRISSAVGLMENNIISKLPRATSFTSLNAAINDYLQKQLYTQIPLFLLIFQIVGIILYYVATVANMVIEQEATEIALLRSRGANTTQVFGILFMEGVIITTIGGIAGPFLGALIFKLLGKTSPFHPLSGGGFLPVHFSSSVFILAAVSAVFCLIAFMLPAIQATRRGIVQQRQQLARPPRAAFWQRYYLDIVLLFVGAGLYYELHQRGTLTQQSIFGNLSIDPLLLITPLLFMIAVAIIFLRIFPFLIMAAEKLSRYVANSSVIISLRYMARNPVHYTRLILLLLLAASMGAFSASFMGTLNQSYKERTMYAAGADVRLENLNTYTSGEGAIHDKYAAIPGVEQISVAYRGSATVGTSFTQNDATILAVDPNSIAQVAWFRSDFAPKTLGSLMTTLADDKPQSEGLVLPEGSEKLGVWVRPVFQQTAKITIWARVEDGKNQYYDFQVGTPSLGDWQYIETSIKPIFSNNPLTSPITLRCLWVSTSGSRVGESLGFNMDELQVKIAGSSDPIVVDNFDDVSGWTPLVNDQSAVLKRQSLDTLKSDVQIKHEGQASARYVWFSGGTYIYRGIFPNMDQRPLKAIVSRQFLESTGIQLGQSSLITIRMPGQYLLIEVVDVVNYFPTLDPEKQGFVLVNLDRLMSLRSRVLGSQIYLYPNEIWLTLTKDQTIRSTAMATLMSPGYGAHTIYDTVKILADQKSDPLIAAGWGGVLMLAFFGVALVSALGFIVYAYLSARSRQLEFAILRTLGFSLRQIIALIGFEQLFIILMGMGLGTYVGVVLSGVMMPFLQLTEHGQRVLPPFIFVTDWTTILTTYGVLAVSFAITISLVIVYFTRVTIYRTLRMGDQ